MYQLDHIVHFVERPEDAMQYFQNAGFHVVVGGKHDAWGTYNALTYFDLSYIEFIGIYNEEIFQKAAKQKYTLHESYEKRNRINGLIRMAISTTSIDKDAQSFQEAGFDVFGPETFSRTRLDGSVVSWKLLHIGFPNANIEFPFFIQWDQDEQLRRNEYKSRGIIADHPLGKLQLQTVNIIVPNFYFIEQFAKLCDAPVEMKEDNEMNSEIATVSLQNASMIFARPLGEGPIWDEILETGYGIQKVIFTGANVQQEIMYDGALFEVKV